MYKSLLFSILILTFGIALIAQDAAPAKESAAVRVNGTAISKGDVETQSNLLKFQMEQNGRKVPASMQSLLRKQAADSLVQMELLLEAAHKEKYDVSEGEVNAEMENVIKNFGAKEQYEAAMKEAGISKEYFRNQIQKTLIIDKYIQGNVKSDGEVSEEEMKTYYDANPVQFQKPEQLRASHILFKVDQTADEVVKQEALKKAQAAHKRAAGGEDFAELAKELSEGPSGPKGGDLGFFSKGRMVPSFEEAAFALKKGEISGVVETRFGYHLIKVTDQQVESMIPLEEVKERLKPYLVQLKTKDAVQDVIEAERAKAKIEYLDDTLNPELEQ